MSMIQLDTKIRSLKAKLARLTLFEDYKTSSPIKYLRNIVLEIHFDLEIALKLLLLNKFYKQESIFTNHNKMFFYDFFIKPLHFKEALDLCKKLTLISTDTYSLVNQVNQERNDLFHPGRFKEEAYNNKKTARILQNLLDTYINVNNVLKEAEVKSTINIKINIQE